MQKKLRVEEMPLTMKRILSEKKAAMMKVVSTRRTCSWGLAPVDGRVVGDAGVAVEDERPILGLRRRCDDDSSAAVVADDVLRELAATPRREDARPALAHRVALCIVGAEFCPIMTPKLLALLKLCSRRSCRARAA